VREATRVAEPEKKTPGAWLGVEMQNIDTETAPKLGLTSPRGVLVVWLPENSPALAAGVIPGDAILKANEATINDMQGLLDRIKANAPGSCMKLRIWRDGQQIEKTVTLAERAPELDNGATVNTTELKLRACPEASEKCGEVARMPQGLHDAIIGRASNGWMKLYVPVGEGKFVRGFANSKFLQF
jgi:C-terminal processing protease CtpA/Prc